MKVCLVISGLRGGGAERVMVWLADRLAAVGHDVTLVTIDEPTLDHYECADAVRRITLGGTKRYLDSSRVSVVLNPLRWCAKLRKTVKQLKPDVMLSFIDGMNVYCLAWLLDTKIPIVVSERTDPTYGLISGKKKWLRPFLYRNRADAVVFQTSAVCAKFASEWRLKNAKVIPNAAQTHVVEGTLATQSPTVLCVGRFDDMKGQDVLIRAWAQLGAARDGWLLRLVGDGVNRQKYAELVASLGIQDSVILAGQKSDMATEYAQASVVVVPSRVEGFPNVLLESMAAGKAVAVSDLPDACREVVRHESDGLLYSGDSVDDLAATLARLLSDAKLRTDLGTNALAVRDRYSSEGIFAMWEECLQAAHRGSEVTSSAASAAYKRGPARRSLPMNSRRDI
jgi:GalNAc-alpha-(1->4)-GalNAc-alpha-(1->3)-diNAcBac-PP-undecaprenol alpha-1,4-N-acetyl-D-galactosaminyltransferase